MAFVPFTATTSALQAVPWNPDRSSLTIRNQAGSTAFVSNDQDSITTKGFPLAVGEFISLSYLFGDEPDRAIYAQTLLGTADLRINEGFGPRALLAPAAAGAV